jgi:replication initiation and membrane attachment protein DnaB
MVDKKLNGKYISKISWDWIGKLQPPIGGYVFRVALYVLFQKGVKGTSKDLIISSSGINKFYKMDKKAINKALHELEYLGLVTVERQIGRSPKVTIVDY